MSQEKAKQEKAEVKTIAPYNKLYILLLIVAVAFTGISLLFKEKDAIFTIWTSISCGAIASILVAWLIDAVNCRQSNKKAVEQRETLLSNLYHVFDNGLQLLVFEGAEKITVINRANWYKRKTFEHEREVRAIIVD